MATENELSIMQRTVPETVSPEAARPTALIERAETIFLESFGTEFSIVDGQTASTIYAAPDQPTGDERLSEIAKIVSPSNSV